MESTDDIDVLMFAYAHTVAERQEGEWVWLLNITFIVFVGVVGITSLEHNLLETHTH